MYEAFDIEDRNNAQSLGRSGTVSADVVAELVGHADRPVGVEWVTPSNLTIAHKVEWQALAATTAEPNVFADPWLVLAGMRHCLEGEGAILAFVRDNSRTLIGVVPLTARFGFGRLPIRLVAGWTHPNSFLMTMSIASGRGLEFWLLLLPALREGPLKAPIMCLEGLPADGDTCAALKEACGQLGLPLAVEASVTRAMLATDADPETYWDESVRAKKRKELRRQWARLNEVGELTTDQLSNAPKGSAAAWAEEFMRLEASGWKGSNGSALSSNPDTEAFFRTAMTDAEASGQIEMTALRIDGQAIAMLITLFSGKAGFSFKTAFDESYARFSPGVLLQRESLAILSQRQLDWIDSCAAQDHPMIDSLWRERRTVVTIALPLPGMVNRMWFAGAQMIKRLWHGIKSRHALRTDSPTPRPDQQPGPDSAGSVQEDQP